MNRIFTGSGAHLDIKSNVMEKDPLILVLHRIAELLEELLAQDNQFSRASNKTDSDQLQKLIDSSDVKAVLKISDSTLYRIKKSKLVSTVRIGKREYFNMSEIMKLTNHFLK